MTIRTATGVDIPALCDLLCLLFNQEAEFQADAAAQAAGLRQIIDAPELGRILVLCDGETVVGMVNLLFTVSTALGGRVAILEDMVVRPERRGGGAGSQLLRAAIELCRSANCLRITLLTDRSNQGAQGFYARHGFTLSDMVPMRRLL
jgi:GNAT superfamily N-acetyltransferase